MPDTPEGLPFDKKDLDKINTNLLISLVAQQQALFEALLEHYQLPEVQARMLELYPVKMQAALGHLYTQYGVTPDVLMPDDDKK